MFDGRPPLPMYIVAGPVVWLIVAHLPSFAGDLELRFLLASGIITTYTWLTAYEFWRGRSEPLVSRWPAILMLFAHGALFLLRTPLFAMLPWSPTDQVFESVWLTVLSFEALLFTIAIAFILLAMAKERTEYRHRTAAMVDPLTGIANRRSFLQDGTELMKRIAPIRVPTGVLLIDLDHFKSINDRFGHAIGDRVLQVFADTAKANMRSIRSHRPARRRGVRGRALQREPGKGGGAGRAHPLGVRRSGERGRRPSGRRDRQHRRRASRRTPRSTSRRCWCRPIRRSISPRSAGATASRSPRSISCWARTPQPDRQGRGEERRLADDGRGRRIVRSSAVVSIAPPSVFRA